MRSTGNPEAIFQAAVEIDDADQRAAFLDKACRGDEALRKQVDGLLKAEADAEGFFEGVGAVPAQAAATALPPALEGPGVLLGQFQLGEKLGEGGFGIVYRAQQIAPVRREVAIKIIKLGMDTREVIRRFEAERQALALMEHPHIAAVYEAGATATGRPYFVMELVRGQAVTAYCDAHVLTIGQRLELFIQICQAVQHAHQKGIIHRDLKPSNILVSRVDGQPRPKVIDFGIVKATGPQLTGETLVTHAHEILGTPAYMSPEQASLGRIDIDTRSDIYALGVLLYELLTGHPSLEPDKVQNASLDVVLQMIREHEPCTPSMRLGRLPDPDLRAMAGLRQCHAQELVRMVRGDLDWIVMKALEKERSCRYESASAMAADVERFLKHEPVSAAAPSTTYQLRKFARRYRTAFAMAGVVAGVLVLSSIVSTWLAFRATRAERQSSIEAANARRQASIAEATRKFLTDDVLSAADPMTVNRLDMRVREALDQAARKLDQHFQEEPLVEAEIRSTLSRIYSNLGDHERALPQATRALELRERNLGATNREALRAKRAVAVNYLSLREHNPRYLDQAEDLLRQALETSRQSLADGDEVAVDITTALATTLFDRERYAEAFQLTEHALATWTNAHGLDNPRAANIIANYAGDYALLPAKEKNADKEQQLFELALAVSRKAFGEKNPNNVLRLINLATFLLNQDRVSQAEPLLLNAVALAKEALGDTHPWTWNGLHTLMRARLLEGNKGEAVAAADEEWHARTQGKPGNDPAEIEALTRIGDEFESHDALTEAVGYYRKGLEYLGANRPKDGRSLACVAYWMVATGDYAAAGETLRQMETLLSGPSTNSTGASFGSRRALLAMMAHRPADYLEARARLLDQFGTPTTPQIASDVARICLLAPGMAEDNCAVELENLVSLVVRAIGSEDVSAQPWYHLTVAMERYRASDWDAAAQHLRHAVAGPVVCQASAQLLLAMISQKRGDSPAAGQLIAEAQHLISQQKGSKFPWWDQYVFYLILLQEAQNTTKAE